MIRHRLISQLDGDECTGVDQLIDLTPTLFVQQDQPDHFHAAGGGAGTSTDGAHHDQHDRQERRPPVKAGGSEASGRANGDHLKNTMPQGIADTRVDAPVKEHGDSQKDNDRKKTNICPHF